MKNMLRTFGIVCAALCLSFALSSAPAKAMDGPSDMVRTAQMRLAGLGYYVGRYDGLMGPVTQSAIMQFQHLHGMPMSGQLTPQIYNMLLNANYVSYAPAYTVAGQIAWDNRWIYAQTQNIPTRYGALNIRDDVRGTMHHYTITFNNQPVLFVKNQPVILRVSNTFAMAGEDAVILTAYWGDGACTYKNYLLTMRANGTHLRPREIGNCSGGYEAQVVDNALFIRFPYAANGWVSNATWRYENTSLVRVL